MTSQADMCYNDEKKLQTDADDRRIAAPDVGTRRHIRAEDTFMLNLPKQFSKMISDARTLILIDGDNCISIALLGIEHVPEDAVVIAYFSQKAAHENWSTSTKFRKYHILSRKIPSGPQAVDWAMLKDAERYEENGQQVYLVSYDKGFLPHCSQKIRLVRAIDEICW